MASVTSFIRNMPASSLQAYFNHTGIELPTAVDWTAPEPEVIRVTLRAVDEMDEEAKARVLNDAERVSGLADDAGQTALYSVIDDRAHLDVIANGHARSLWMFLNRPILFRPKGRSARCAGRPFPFARGNRGQVMKGMSPFAVSPGASSGSAFNRA